MPDTPINLFGVLHLRISAAGVWSSTGFGCPVPYIEMQGERTTTEMNLTTAIANYLFGVQWDDDFRFILSTEGSECRGHSKTQNITAYTIHKQEKSPFPYCLTIVNTPGFGDA